jgi:hypothetical protein
MSKRYLHYVDNVAVTNAAELKAIADTNPAEYPVGGIYALPNGVLCNVTANDGSAVTISTITSAVI